MPVAKGRNGSSRQLLILGVATVLGIAAMYFLVSRAGELASSGDVDVNLGSSTFEPGNVERLAEDIAKQGPLLLPDLIEGRDRDIMLQHVGDEDTEGWHAFAVREASASRDCFIEWRPDEQKFVDTCDGTEYDEIGTGLQAYPVLIDAKGNLSIDINAADRQESEEG